MPKKFKLERLPFAFAIAILSIQCNGSESIGGPANGCIAYSTELPLESQSYQVLRPKRSRYFAHSSLIEFIHKIGLVAQRENWGTLLVGDLSAAEGGPLIDGHRSHQNGLDADILFTMPAQPLSENELAKPEMPEMVMPDGKNIDPERWKSGQEQLLKLIAEEPQVDRVFVSAAIKKHLCQQHSGEAWLRKIRPWWGHTEHLHLRMLCPSNSRDCINSNPIPNGDGCDASLNWFEENLPSKEPPQKLIPPARCDKNITKRK